MKLLFRYWTQNNTVIKCFKFTECKVVPFKEENKGCMLNEEIFTHRGRFLSNFGLKLWFWYSWFEIYQEFDPTNREGNLCCYEKYLVNHEYRSSISFIYIFCFHWGMKNLFRQISPIVPRFWGVFQLFKSGKPNSCRIRIIQ